ncbi:hypothetical protein TIFTF001_015295 [Ficus carica]|uniref:Uncharacterized protein n=1 Tax=Ficus carica TaxID=3494 RepID=A0AA88AS91_FICCA|nr:hypothetical protein TIFTF001_015295 [Ficus carica]
MLDGLGAQATEPLTASHGHRCGGRRDLGAEARHGWPVVVVMTVSRDATRQKMTKCSGKVSNVMMGSARHKEIRREVAPWNPPLLT